MESHPEDMDQILEYEKAKRMTLKSYQRQLQAVMHWAGIGNRLGDISVPTLVVHGNADRLMPYRQRSILGHPYPKGSTA